MLLHHGAVVLRYANSVPLAIRAIVFTAHAFFAAQIVFVFYFWFCFHQPEFLAFKILFYLVCGF